MTRAKAKWRVEGERCSKYFCNLEKLNYIFLDINPKEFVKFAYKSIQTRRFSITHVFQYNNTFGKNS
jgi:hypothetical protein